MSGGVIYDFGMNNGDDVEYYLLKSSKVVGVEANPALCRAVEKRFSCEIEAGKLVVLNVAISAGDEDRTVDFHVHKTNHVLSHLGAPDAASIGDFDRIEVLSRTPTSIIREHGEPRYIKVDLEGMDAVVLKDIFDAGMLPPEISAEAHSADVFDCLRKAGYKAFNLVDGWSVAEKYGTATIEIADGIRPFSFRPHSAGPFGSDIRSEWQDPETFSLTLSAVGFGWKDIHASNLVAPSGRPGFAERLWRRAVALGRRTVRGLRELAKH